MNNKLKTKKNAKRWFVNAAGWGFELALGSGSHQPIGTKTKRSISASSDSKRNFLNNIGQSNLVQGTMYYLNPLSQIAQGTSTSNRIADRIFIENLSIRVLISNVGSTSGNSGATFRFLLVASTAQTAATAGFTSGGGFTAANVFMQNSNQPSLAVVDPQLARVLCDEVVTLQPTVASSNPQDYFNIDCPVNAWFEYQPSTTVGVAANLYWIMFTDIYAGTPGTTVGGSIQASSLVVFRDTDA